MLLVKGKFQDPTQQTTHRLQVFFQFFHFLLRKLFLHSTAHLAHPGGGLLLFLSGFATVLLVFGLIFGFFLVLGHLLALLF